MKYVHKKGEDKEGSDNSRGFDAKTVLIYAKTALEWLLLFYGLLKEFGLLVIQKPSKRSLFDIA